MKKKISIIIGLVICLMFINVYKVDAKVIECKYSYSSDNSDRLTLKINSEYS